MYFLQSVFPDIDKKTLPETIYGKTKKNIAKVPYSFKCAYR